MMASPLATTMREYRRTLSRRMSYHLGTAGTSVEFCESLPHEAQAFYDVLGHFWNTHTKAYAPTLTPYQLDLWSDMQRSRFRFYPKAQKLGVTAFELMIIIYKALTSDRGNSMYIVSQDMNMAMMHLDRLKTMLRDSPLLRPYLVERPPKDMYGVTMRSSASRTNVAVIANPGRPTRPTRIYAKTITNEGNLISHTDVSHILMSDISAAVITKEKMESSFGGAVTRLLNTRGSMVIESPPSWSGDGLMNRLGFEIMDELGMEEEFEPNGRLYESKYWYARRLHWSLGVEHGLFSKEEVDADLVKMGAEGFKRYMEASMYTGQGTAFAPGMAEQVDTLYATRVANAFFSGTVT